MSKPSRRPTREARKKHKAKKQAAQRELHRCRAEAGLSPPTSASANVSNRLSNWKTGEEEQAGREEAAGVQLEVAHVERLRRLIRGKKFRRYLIKKCYPIALDGTQKLVRDGQW